MGREEMRMTNDEKELAYPESGVVHGVIRSMTRRLILLLLPLFFVSCAGFKPQPLLSKVLIFRAADFGSEAMSAPLLGAGSEDRQVIVHHGLSTRYLDQHYPGTVRIYAAPAIKHLNRSVTDTPRDVAHAVLRSRLIQTRSQILDFYSQRRIAFNSVPPYTGRGFMARQMIMPSIGTTR
jgi:hypothetical protein